MSDKKPYPWVAVFIEIVLRAMRKIHFDYIVWGIGRQWKMSPEKAKLINMGHGIELVDERFVCATITQEFMNSPAVAGFWAKDEKEKEELRYFTIDREYLYASLLRIKREINKKPIYLSGNIYKIKKET